MREGEKRNMSRVSCSLSSQLYTIPLSSFPTPFTVFIVLSIVCTGVGWKCLDFGSVLVPTPSCLFMPTKCPCTEIWL